MGKSGYRTSVCRPDWLNWLYPYICLPRTGITGMWHLALLLKKFDIDCSRPFFGDTVNHLGGNSLNTITVSKQMDKLQAIFILTCILEENAVHGWWNCLWKDWGVALLEDMCHWRWRLQKRMLGQCSISDSRLQIDVCSVTSPAAHLPACCDTPHNDSHRLILWNCKFPIKCCLL